MTPLRCASCDDLIDTTGWAHVNGELESPPRLCSRCWLKALFPVNQPQHHRAFCPVRCQVEGCLRTHSCKCQSRQKQPIYDPRTVGWRDFQVRLEELERRVAVVLNLCSEATLQGDIARYLLHPWDITRALTDLSPEARAALDGA